MLRVNQQGPESLIEILRFRHGFVIFLGSNGTMKKAEGFVVGCPDCGNDALYRYGRIWTGRQRYVCLLCGRQFTLGSTRKEWKNKPTCPCCGKQMYFYHKGKDVIRFRCSNYPDCKQYVKIKIATKNESLLFSE